MKNNLLSETDALGNVISYAYSPESWLTSKTKADGTVLTYEYDRTGSLLTRNLGEGQSIATAYNEIGQVTTATNENGTITYQYDNRGNLVSVENIYGEQKERVLQARTYDRREKEHYSRPAAGIMIYSLQQTFRYCIINCG